MQPFEVADDGDHREGSLDAHPFVPGPLCTPFQVLRDAVLAAEAQVTPGNRLAGKAGHEGMEVRIGGVERRPIPGDDLTVVVEQPAELDPHGPAAFIFTFAAHLPSAASFTNGKDQCDRLAIDDREETGIGHEPVKPGVMGLHQTLEPGPVGQSREQPGLVAGEPAHKGAKVPPFQGKQEADSHDLTRIQDRLGVLALLRHPVIDKAE